MNTWGAGESSRLTATTSASLSATSTSANAAIATASDPVTRSRTNFFLSIRASSVRPPRTSARRYSLGYDPDSAYGIDAPATANEESQGLLSGVTSSGGGPTAASGRLSPNHVAITLNPEPPNWVDISERVNETLGRTKSKIAQLDKLHAKHALPGFADRSAEEREIETLTTDITRDFRKCQALIQQISPGSSSSSSGGESHTFPPSSSSGPPSRHQVLAAQNVQRGLAAKVQDLSNTFRKKQRVYMQTLQGHAIKNQDLLVASGAITLKGSDSLTALQEDVEASRSQLKSRQTQHPQQQQQQQQLVNADPNLETRSREITEIAKSIASLAEVFKDLSNLVIDQGTILDSVEYNMEQTAIHVQEAAKDLDVATKYQKNIGRRKCIFLLLLIIVGLILVLIFKPRRHGGSTLSPIPTPSAHESEGGLLRFAAIRS